MRYKSLGGSTHEWVNVNVDVNVNVVCLLVFSHVGALNGKLLEFPFGQNYMRILR